MEKRKIRVKIAEAFKLSYEYFSYNLSRANDIWSDLIKHVTTLASTILVLSVSFRKENPLTKWDYLDWGFLFLSIFFGILCIASTAYLFDKLARKELKDKLKLLSEEFFQGREEYELEATAPSIVNGHPWLGAICIIMFLLGSFGMLIKIIGAAVKAKTCFYISLYVSFILLILAILYTFRKAIFVKDES